jgi:hypothetical protein
MRHALAPSFALVSTLALLAGCASQSPDAPTTSSQGLSQGTLDVASGGTTALDLMKQGGTFMFSLDESDPAATFHAQCQKESAGDAAKADACYAHIRQEGSQEGMRFSLDPDQHVVWTSFGLEDGKEAIYIQSPMALTTDGERAVVATFAAAPRGVQVEGQPNWAAQRIHFAFPDASTMVMNDKSKGKLVFHRAAGK